MGIVPMPWQETAATYLTARGPDDTWLFREVAVVVARQNGKTTLTQPLIVQRLRAGRRIMHIAQVRELPRIMFEVIADALEAEPDLFPRRRGKIIWPRRGAGSESIVLTNGATYRIASAISGGRGFSFDDLLIDELREMDTFDVVNAAKPAQRFSKDPQTIYLSNAGTSASVILNSLRARSGNDPSLAYLEWSASREYQRDDIRGWLQADPAIGHYPQVLADLEKDYRAAKLGGNMTGFETESLCWWVTSTDPPVASEADWLAARAELGIARRPCMAISMDPSGRRASAVIAWRRTDLDDIGVRLVAEVEGDPIEVERFGPDLRSLARDLGVQAVGFASATDADLARYFPKAKALDGKWWAVASGAFVDRLASGRLHWDDAAEIGSDLGWTVRKSAPGGSWQAAKASDDRPITAVQAAIRAVWLASGPRAAAPKVM
jgi:hypothetical protein